MRVFRSIAWLFIAAAILSAAGCGGGGNSTQLRVLQGTADAGTVDVLVDGTKLFSSVAFAAPTAYSKVSSGTRHLQVELTGNTTPVIDENVTLSDSTKYTLITTNFLSNITP